MKTWVGIRDATDALRDLGCRYNHLNLKRKAGELDGLFIKDPRTKQGHWLYDVEGIREKVLSGKLYFGAHRPPIVESRTELRVTFAISIELAEKLLKRDHDTELVIIQEIRNAVGSLMWKYRNGKDNIANETGKSTEGNRTDEIYQQP